VDAVAAADHRGVPVLDGEPADDLDEARKLGLDDAHRVPQYDGRCRVEHIGAREAVVQPTPLGPELLGHGAEEGDDVVLRLSFDLGRALCVDLAGRPLDPLPVVVRDDALVPQRLHGEQLDAQPERELVLLPEELAQLRQGVPIDHPVRIPAEMGSGARVDPELGLRGLLISEGRNPRRELRVGERQDAGRQMGGVLRAGTPDRNRRDRHSRRHLDDRVQRIGGTEHATIERNADDRLPRQARQHARQVRRQPGRPDEEAHARLFRLGDVRVQGIGLAVRADDRCLPADVVAVEDVEAALEGRKITAGPAQDGDGWHGRRIAIGRIGRVPFVVGSSTRSPKRGDPMRYLLLLHGDAAAEAALSPAERREVIDAHIAFSRGLREAGRLVVGEGLQPPDRAKRVTWAEDGARIVTDGPFAEAKEAIGGFYLLECGSIEEAVGIADGVPRSPGLAVEIIPVEDV
jgi:hypothetical protein